MRSAAAALGAALTLTAAGCGSPSGSPRPPRPPAPVPRLADAFDRERAWSDLVELCSLGPRAHGTTGYRACQDLLRRRLREAGATVRETTFEHQGVRDTAPTVFTNISGRFGPPEGEWILLGTHYDTRLWADEDPDPRRRAEPIQGANDGGSGVAVFLEVARVLSEHPPALGVEIVFFDGEDYGPRGSPDYFLGSRHLARTWETHHGASRPLYAIVLDMVGDADLRFHRDARAQREHAWLNDHLWAAARRLGHGEHVTERTLGVTDDHTALQDMGIPATLLIDFEFPAWHTAADTLELCSPDSLAVTGRIVLESLTPPAGPE